MSDATPGGLSSHICSPDKPAHGIGEMFEPPLQLSRLALLGHVPSYTGTAWDTPSPMSRTSPVVRPDAYSDSTAWMATYSAGTWKDSIMISVVFSLEVLVDRDGIDDGRDAGNANALGGRS